MLWATSNSDTGARPSRGRHAGASQRRGRRASARLRKRQSDASLGSCRHVARTSVGRARSDRRGLLPHPRKRRCPGGFESRLETSALEVRTTRSRLELTGGAPCCKRRAAQAATVGPRRCRGESPPSARRGVASTKALLAPPSLSSRSQWRRSRHSSSLVKPTSTCSAKRSGVSPASMLARMRASTSARSGSGSPAIQLIDDMCASTRSVSAGP
jgi:hypothetical protein